MTKAKKVPQVSGGKLLRTPRDDLFIVRVGVITATKTPADQKAGKLLRVVSRALDKPGIRRDTVFHSHTGKRVYAYSLDPRNPDLLVREDESGKKATGRLVNGAFRKIPARA